MNIGDMLWNVGPDVSDFIQEVGGAGLSYWENKIIQASKNYDSEDLKHYRAEAQFEFDLAIDLGAIAELTINVQNTNQ